MAWWMAPAVSSWSHSSRRISRRRGDPTAESSMASMTGLNLDQTKIRVKTRGDGRRASRPRSSPLLDEGGKTFGIDAKAFDGARVNDAAAFIEHLTRARDDHPSLEPWRHAEHAKDRQPRCLRQNRPAQARRCANHSGRKAAEDARDIRRRP